MLESKKIGIMGGTFNPIHNGHLLLAEWAREALALDKVIFIPTGVSYLKKDDHVICGTQRLDMVNLAIKGNDFFCSSDIEIRREGNTYTFETLKELKELYPKAQIYFIVGADCLLYMDKWYCCEEIFKNCTIVAANRNENSLKDLESKKQELVKRYYCNIELITFPQIDISSTDIRNRTKASKSVKYMLPDSVIDYININKLYQ